MIIDDNKQKQNSASEQTKQEVKSEKVKAPEGQTSAAVIPQDQFTALMQTVGALVELQKISALREQRKNQKEEVEIAQ